MCVERGGEVELEILVDGWMDGWVTCWYGDARLCRRELRPRKQRQSDGTSRGDERMLWRVLPGGLCRL